MPKLLRARAPQDPAEEGMVRRVAGSRHAPADWRLRAQMIVRSWAGREPGVDSRRDATRRPGHALLSDRDITEVAVHMHAKRAHASPRDGGSAAG